MKGVVFVKFGEFVEQTWGDGFWDELLESAELPSGGIYTTVANVDDQELFTLIGLIVQKKGLSPEQAQFAFGKWIFAELLGMAPPQAHDFKDVFEFLFAVENFIHVEVKKLTPDAILPTFHFLEHHPDRLKLHYVSPRKLCFFCEGLIAGLAEHTGQTVTISHAECEHRGDERCVLDVIKA